MQFQDIEEPGALHQLSSTYRELILLCTAPDSASVSMYRNSRASISKLGLERNILTLADSFDSCRRLNVSQCVWSSRFTNEKPGRSVSLDKFWDWRFKFYFVKKKLLADLVQLNVTVLQADTDAVWIRDPFPLLRNIRSSIVVQNDGPFANAGLMYAKRGSKQSRSLLFDVAWRIQLFQNHPHMVKHIVSFAKEPFYANSDDQTILNDAIQSAALRRKIFLGSTARFEARSRYFPSGPEWSSTAEYNENQENVKAVHSMARKRRYNKGNGTFVCKEIPISAEDSVCVVSNKIFAHAVDSYKHSCIYHVAGVRGFAAKREFLKRKNLWYVA